MVTLVFLSQKTLSMHSEILGLLQLKILQGRLLVARCYPAQTVGVNGSYFSTKTATDDVRSVIVIAVKKRVCGVGKLLLQEAIAKVNRENCYRLSAVVVRKSAWF